MVTPRNSLNSAAAEFTDIPANGVSYEIEEDERIPEAEGASNSNTGAQTDSNYQRLFDASVSTPRRRSHEGPHRRAPLVEIPDNILSSPTSLTPRSPQPNYANRPGSESSQRQRSQTHLNNSRNNTRSPEGTQVRQNPRGDPRHIPSVRGDNFAATPDMHLYHFYARNGERIIEFSMESSNQHVVIDITPHEESFQIRAWYIIPLN